MVLDPNSDLIREYINASYSKAGWQNIDKEIGLFNEVIDNPLRTRDEQIDAKGYYAICKFKITSHLYKLDAGKQSEEIARLSLILERDFGLTGSISFEQIAEHTLVYAQGLYDEYKDKSNKTVAENSALCQAAACLMRSFEMGKNINDFAEVARTHFLAAENCANMGSSRGCTYLSTAYGWLQNPKIPYRAAVSDLIQMAAGRDFGQFCQDKRYELDVRAAELGSIEAKGALGVVQLDKGEDIATAIDNLTLAAEFGFSKYQYELGKFYLIEGDFLKARQYFDMARANDFDVEAKLEQEGLEEPEMLFTEVIESGAKVTNQSWAEFIEQQESKDREKGFEPDF